MKLFHQRAITLSLWFSLPYVIASVNLHRSILNPSPKEILTSSKFLSWNWARAKYTAEFWRKPRKFEIITFHIGGSLLLLTFYKLIYCFGSFRFSKLVIFLIYLSGMNLKSSRKLWWPTPSQIFVKEDFDWVVPSTSIYLTIPFAWKEKIC